ncbi:MAG TPA: alpha-L-rhamnosidase C-terminal domain-containing protein, partial [Cytophagaceae bacterium]
MSNRSLILHFIIFANCLLVSHAQVKYPPITAQKVGSEIPYSPDPLVAYKWKNPQANDGLESYILYPQSYTSSAPGSFNMSKFKEGKEITVLGKGSIRFDFGRTSAGWLEFESDDLADSITLSISEYNEPAIVNVGAANRFKTKAPVKNGNTYRLELNEDLYEGVRFGWLHIHTNSRPWHIHNLRLVCQVKPTNYQGSFSSSDTTLTRIWYTGAYTVKVNFQKDHFGAILMERSDRYSWTGDAYPSQAASMVAFGNFDFVKDNLRRTETQNNGILSYSLYWVLSLIDYVNYSGDVQYAKTFISKACGKLDTAYQHFDKPGYLVFYGWDERLGAGIENPNITESLQAYSMLTIQTWMEFGNLMLKMGETDLGHKYINYAKEKFNESKSKSNWPKDYGIHASADVINSGLTSPSDDSLFYTKNFNSRLERISYSPFNQYFIINAMARLNKFDEAFSTINDCWGGQLNYGGTTFFEVFHPSWNSFLAKNDAIPNGQSGYTSLAHPWSSGVVKWLSEEALGIKPLEPGFKTFQIIPHLGKTLEWVEGTSPTGNGLISAYFNRTTGISKFTIPNATIAKTICIPIGQNTIQEVYLNKKQIWQNGKSKNVGDYKIEG